MRISRPTDPPMIFETFLAVVREARPALSHGIMQDACEVFGMIASIRGETCAAATKAKKKNNDVFLPLITLERRGRGRRDSKGRGREGRNREGREESQSDRKRRGKRQALVRGSSP